MLSAFSLVCLLLSVQAPAGRETAGSAAQTPVDSLKAETDPSHRAEHGLTLAETEFDSARDAYGKGDIHQGDDHLDIMAKALDESVVSFEQAHKSRLYKRAEIRVSHLQRRLNSLVDDIDVVNRGWAEQTARRVAEIHERLLKGAMSK